MGHSVGDCLGDLSYDINAMLAEYKHLPKDDPLKIELYKEAKSRIKACDKLRDKVSEFLDTLDRFDELREQLRAKYEKKPVFKNNISITCTPTIITFGDSNATDL